MTYEEALEKMSNLAVTYSQINADTCELFTFAKSAIEKQIEKPVLYHKPKRRAGGQQITQADIPSYFCPCCISVLFEKKAFCGDCGQAIDWSDEK